MSNTTVASSSALPSGITTAGDLSSSLSILLVGTVGSSFLVPISAALLYFHQSHKQRKAMYLMTLTSLVVGLGEGGLNMYNQINSIRHVAVPSGVTTTYTFVHLFLPLLTESVLVFRVTAMRPPRGLSWPWRTLIYGPIIVLKVARLVVLIAIAISWIENAKGLPAPIQGGLDAFTAINKLPSQLRWALQVMDTLFMSGMFFPRSKKKSKQHKGTEDPSHANKEKEEKLPLFTRLKTLFWNVVTSFVIPVLLNIIQFALVLVQNGVLQFPSLFAVNNQAGIIGMVFATAWSGSPTGDGYEEKPSRHRGDPGTVHHASGAEARRATRRPSLKTHDTEASMKDGEKDDDDESAGSPALPHLLSDDRPAVNESWATSRAAGDQQQQGALGALVNLLGGGSGRSSPDAGGIGDDIGAMVLGNLNVGGALSGVAGALSGGVEGTLGHVGDSFRHLMHGFGESAARAARGELRSKVDDLEAGGIREESRAIEDVKGKIQDEEAKASEAVRDRIADGIEVLEESGDKVKDEATVAVSAVRNEVEAGVDKTGAFVAEEGKVAVERRLDV
ncbi:hypothetical protein C2E23DRAFT_882219 [Lenzites betulinus]|nr:hypothetical protein C2E23DRAFT_882219 [Lenzites betulinus]